MTKQNEEEAFNMDGTDYTKEETLSDKRLLKYHGKEIKFKFYLEEDVKQCFKEIKEIIHDLVMLRRRHDGRFMVITLNDIDVLLDKIDKKAGDKLT